jgi:hypothetical protein
LPQVFERAIALFLLGGRVEGAAVEEWSDEVHRAAEPLSLGRRHRSDRRSR